MITAVDYALTFDTKVIIEKAVVGKEIECAVLQADGEVKVSTVGQIVIADKYEFYDFQAKYLDNSMQLVAPADLPQGVEEKIQAAALTAFNAAGCEGLPGNLNLFEVTTTPSATLRPAAAKIGLA